MNKKNVYQMKFHALAISCNHLDRKKLAEIGEQYYHYISFSTLVNPISSKHYFHVFLISQKHANYLEIIAQIRLEYPHSIVVLLVDDITNIQEIIQQNILFFLLNTESSQKFEVSIHQLWCWLLSLEKKKHSIEYFNMTVTIAGGVLSFIDETYTKDNKTYSLTKKQIEILKILLEYRGQTVSRIELLDRIWFSDKKIVTDRVIDTNVVALRKMFKDNGREPKFLHTIFGQGYRLSLE